MSQALTKKIVSELEVKVEPYERCDSTHRTRLRHAWSA